MSTGFDNLGISELLAVAAEQETDHRQRALRRAAHTALVWPEEITDVIAEDQPITDLPSVGPWTSRLIEGWIRDEVEPPEPPAIRAGFTTLARARKAIRDLGAPPIRGDLQVHSEWSDGNAPIEVMAEAAHNLGHEYFGLTDHSKGLKIANGMSEEKLGRQIDVVTEINANGTGRARILHALEMNLSIEGEGDMDPSSLDPLAPVLGAFHSKLRVVEDQTGRYLAALRNPDIHVLAHPRGRMYDRRPGLNADWPRVFAAAADAGIALECDCTPDRQDLNVELLSLAAQAGVTISLGTDAHAPNELRFVELGCGMLAMAGVPHDQILNCRSADEVLSWASEHRARARSRI